LAGNISKAIEHLQLLQKLKEDPGQVGVDFRGSKIKGYLRQIRLLTEQNMSSEAITVATEALALFPTRAEVHLAYGKVLLKAGKLIDALHAFEKSLSLNRNDNLDSFIGLCIIYKRAGADSKVIETLQAINPLFENREKFKAFCVLFNKNLCSSENEKDLKDHYEQIRKEFFGVI
jgi:tetratricopeptide (TPR) repeat protein